MLDQGVTFNMFEEIQKTKTEEEEVKWLKLIHKVLVSWDKQSSEWVTIIDHTFSLLEQRQPYAIFYFKSPIKIPEIEGKMTTGTSKEDYEEAKLLPPENVYLLENISVSAYQVRKIDTSWKALIFVESGNVKEIPIREKWVIVRPKQFEVVYQ